MSTLEKWNVYDKFKKVFYIYIFFFGVDNLMQTLNFVKFVIKLDNSIPPSI